MCILIFKFIFKTLKIYILNSKCIFQSSNSYSKL